MVHHCHAHGCTKAVPPKMFMCAPHWFSLRKPMRDAIWREYRPGQEKDKSPSLRYLAVSFRAISEVARKGVESATSPEDAAARSRFADHYIQLSEESRREAIADGAGDPLAGLGSKAVG